MNKFLKKPSLLSHKQPEDIDEEFLSSLASPRDLKNRLLFLDVEEKYVWLQKAAIKGELGSVKIIHRNLVEAEQIHIAKIKKVYEAVQFAINQQVDKPEAKSPVFITCLINVQAWFFNIYPVLKGKALPSESSLTNKMPVAMSGRRERKKKRRAIGKANSFTQTIGERELLNKLKECKGLVKPASEVSDVLIEKFQCNKELRKKLDGNPELKKYLLSLCLHKGKFIPLIQALLTERSFDTEELEFKVSVNLKELAENSKNAAIQKIFEANALVEKRHADGNLFTSWIIRFLSKFFSFDSRSRGNKIHAGLQLIKSIQVDESLPEEKVKLAKDFKAAEFPALGTGRLKSFYQNLTKPMSSHSPYGFFYNTGKTSPPPVNAMKVPVSCPKIKGC